MNHLPHLYTLQEAAIALRIHESTLDREIRDGRLNCTRIRRRVFVTAEQLNHYINNQGGHPCPEDSLNTASTGLSNETENPTTTSTGANQERGESTNEVPAPRALQPPRRGSRSSSGREAVFRELDKTARFKTS